MPESLEPRSERQPALILAVYVWDVLLIVLAVFQALAPLSGAVSFGPRQEALPAWLEFETVLSPALFAAVLIVLTTSLTRRVRWVQRAQIGVLVTAIVLQAASIAVVLLKGGS